MRDNSLRAETLSIIFFKLKNKKGKHFTSVFSQTSSVKIKSVFIQLNYIDDVFLAFEVRSNCFNTLFMPYTFCSIEFCFIVEESWGNSILHKANQTKLDLYFYSDKNSEHQEYRIRLSENNE